jgi:hypothetical protein
MKICKLKKSKFLFIYIFISRDHTIAPSIDEITTQEIHMRVGHMTDTIMIF